MIRYRITTLLLSVSFLSVLLGWWADHRQLRYRLDYNDSNALMDAFDHAVALKYGQNTPSVKITETVVQLETQLELTNLSGEFVGAKSWSDEQLRKPSVKTTDKVIEKLRSPNPATILAALKLLALYSEAFIVERRYAYQEIEGDHQHFCDAVTPVLYEFLVNHDANIRGHAAQAIGFTLKKRESIERLTYGYKNESNGSAKHHFAFALARQF